MLSTQEELEQKNRYVEQLDTYLAAAEAREQELKDLLLDIATIADNALDGLLNCTSGIGATVTVGVKGKLSGLKARFQKIITEDHAALNAALEQRTCEVLDALEARINNVVRDLETPDLFEWGNDTGEAAQELLAAHRAALEQAREDTRHDTLRRVYHWFTSLHWDERIEGELQTHKVVYEVKKRFAWGRGGRTRERCLWTWNEKQEAYGTECGYFFPWGDDVPENLGLKWCPFCGWEVKCDD